MAADNGMCEPTVGGKVFRAAGVLWGGNAGVRALAFVRSVIIARLLSPADYGLAATFWLTTSLLAVFTELGIQQRLIQSKDGDSEDVGAVAQTLFLLRGLLIGSVLFLGADFCAAVFNADNAAWAFRLLGVIPVIGGFSHRDIERYKRSLNFAPEVRMQLWSEFITTLGAVPIAYYYRDYSSFLYTAILKTAVQVGISHLLAERPYRLGWNSEIVRSFTGFGWPLLINGIMIYLITQGDRVVLSRHYSKADLGLYSVAFGLVSSIISVVTSGVNPVVLPLLSRFQEDRIQFTRYFTLHCQLMGAIAITIGLLLSLAGGFAIVFLYGVEYSQASLWVSWIAVSECLRLLRIPASCAALSRGDARNSMYGNVARMVGVALAYVAALRGLPISWIPMAGIAGELCSILLTAAFLQIRHDLPVLALAKPGILAVTVLVLGAWWGTGVNSIAMAISFGLTSISVIAVYVIIMRELRSVCVSNCQAVVAVFRRSTSAAK